MSASNGDRKSAQATLAQFKNRLVHRVSNLNAFCESHSFHHRNKILRQAIQYATATYSTTTSSQSQAHTTNLDSLPA